MPQEGKTAFKEATRHNWPLWSFLQAVSVSAAGFCGGASVGLRRALGRQPHPAVIRPLQRLFCLVLLGRDIRCCANRSEGRGHDKIYNLDIPDHGGGETVALYEVRVLGVCVAFL